MYRCLLVLLAACGGGDGGDDNPDAPAGVDSAVDTAGARKRGIVFIQETFVAANQLTTHVAEFRDGPLAATSRVDGPCIVSTGLDTATPAKVSAGMITFTAGTTVTTLFPNNNDYDGRVDNSYLYTDNQQIDIHAFGDTVPAFQTQVVFPAAITVTDPPASSTGSVTRANGFSATWTGTSKVRILITQAGTGVQIACTYSGVTTGAVPASALADLTAGTQAAQQVSIVVAADTPGMVTSGDFDIQLLVVNNGYAAVGVVF
jgi:hypothetical protein